MNDNNEIPELPKINNEVIKEKQDEEIVKEISINDSKTVEEIKETSVKEVKGMKVFFKDIREYITSKNSSELFSLFWRLLLVAGFVILLFVPFQLLMDLGSNLFLLFGANYTSTLATIWTSVWYIAYSILAFVLFFILCKDRYYKFVKNQNNDKKDYETK